MAAPSEQTRQTRVCRVTSPSAALSAIDEHLAAKFRVHFDANFFPNMPTYSTTPTRPRGRVCSAPHTTLQAFVTRVLIRDSTECLRTPRNFPYSCARASEYREQLSPYPPAYPPTNHVPPEYPLAQHRYLHCMSSFGTIPWYVNFEKYGMYHTFQIANLKKKYG